MDKYDNLEFHICHYIFLHVFSHMPQNHIDHEYRSYLSVLLGVVYCVWYAMSDTYCWVLFVVCSTLCQIHIVGCCLLCVVRYVRYILLGVVCCV